jgi:hypothetical protein
MDAIDEVEKDLPKEDGDDEWNSHKFLKYT